VVLLLVLPSTKGLIQYKDPSTKFRWTRPSTTREFPPKMEESSTQRQNFAVVKFCFRSCTPIHNNDLLERAMYKFIREMGTEASPDCIIFSTRSLNSWICVFNKTDICSVSCSHDVRNCTPVNKHQIQRQFIVLQFSLP
jgi:hypothetical protein